MATTTASRVATPTLIVCSLTDGGTAVVNGTTNIDRAMDRWRRMRPGPWVPVAAIEIPEGMFKTVFDIRRLPAEIAVSRAAEIFGRSPVPPALTRHLFSQLRRCGRDVDPLIRGWAKACFLTTDVNVGDAERAEAFTRQRLSG